jgi:hypothetical protein
MQGNAEKIAIKSDVFADLNGGGGVVHAYNV